MLASNEDYSALLEALSRRSDLALVLSDVRTIEVHSQKLALASPMLGEMMDVLEDDLAAAKRQKKGNHEEAKRILPQLKVTRLSCGYCFMHA